MNETKLSVRSEKRKERLRDARRYRVFVGWAFVIVLVAIYAGGRLGARPLFEWFSGTWLWKHTLAGHTQAEYLIGGLGLEAIGFWGISIDRSPYPYFAKNGVETLGGFMWRVRQLGLDLFCIVGGGFCLIRAFYR